MAINAKSSFDDGTVLTPAPVSAQSYRAGERGDAPIAPQGPVSSTGVSTPAVPAAPTGSTGGTTGPAVTVTSTGAVIPATGANAIQMLTALFTGYGLNGDIAAGIAAMKQGGLDDLTIKSIMESPDPSMALKNMNLTPSQQSAGQNLVNAWNTRFAGNVLRQQAGLPPLSAADYISTEDSYKQVMAAAGLPVAVMGKDYFAKLMAVDVSSAEVQQRVNAAMAAVRAEDPFVIQQLNQQGLGTGDMALHLLDPSVASNVIAQKVQAAQISAEAARQNVNTNQDYAMQLAAQGVSQGQAAAGFQNIAQQIAPTQELAARYNAMAPAGGVGGALEAATFGTAGSAQAAAQLEKLKLQEVSEFSGSSGAGKGSLYGTEAGQS